MPRERRGEKLHLFPSLPDRPGHVQQCVQGAGLAEWQDRGAQEGALRQLGAGERARTAGVPPAFAVSLRPVRKCLAEPATAAASQPGASRTCCPRSASAQRTSRSRAAATGRGRDMGRARRYGHAQRGAAPEVASVEELAAQIASILGGGSKVRQHPLPSPPCATARRSVLVVLLARMLVVSGRSPRCFAWFCCP